jgi:hypothetical protein
MVAGASKRVTCSGSLPFRFGPTISQPCLGGPGRSFARVGEGFRPRIHELEQVKAAV